MCRNNLSRFSSSPLATRSDKNELGTWWWQRSHFINISHFAPTAFALFPSARRQPPSICSLAELNIPFFSFCFPLYLTRFHSFAQSSFYGSHIIYDLCFFGVYWQRIKIFRDFITLCWPPPGKVEGRTFLLKFPFVLLLLCFVNYVKAKAADFSLLWFSRPKSEHVRVSFFPFPFQHVGTWFLEIIIKGKRHKSEYSYISESQYDLPHAPLQCRVISSSWKPETKKRFVLNMRYLLKDHHMTAVELFSNPWRERAPSERDY